MALYVQLFQPNLNSEGSCFKLEVDGTTEMTVKEVKKQIKKEKKVPVEDQKMFYAGVELTNGKRLKLVKSFPSSILEMLLINQYEMTFYVKLSIFLGVKAPLGIANVKKNKN